MPPFWLEAQSARCILRTLLITKLPSTAKETVSHMNCALQTWTATRFPAGRIWT